MADRKKEDDDAVKQKKQAKVDNPITSTKSKAELSCDLLLQALTDIGGRYETDDDGDLVIFYQGDIFVVEVEDANPLIEIWREAWYDEDLCNTEEVARIKRLLIDVNQDSEIKFFYDEQRHPDKLYLHSMIPVEFTKVKSCKYLSICFMKYFEMRREFLIKLSKLRAIEEHK